MWRCGMWHIVWDVEGGFEICRSMLVLLYMHSNVSCLPPGTAAGGDGRGVWCGGPRLRDLPGGEETRTCCAWMTVLPCAWTYCAWMTVLPCAWTTVHGCTVHGRLCYPVHGRLCMDDCATLCMDDCATLCMDDCATLCMDDCAWTYCAWMTVLPCAWMYCAWMTVLPCAWTYCA